LIGNSTLAPEADDTADAGCEYGAGAGVDEEGVTPVLVGTVTIGARLDKALWGNAIR
jgi:hypothetical protein